MDGLMDGWTRGWTNGWTDVQTDGRRKIWIDRQTDESNDEYSVCVCVCLRVSVYVLARRCFSFQAVYASRYKTPIFICVNASLHEGLCVCLSAKLIWLNCIYQSLTDGIRPSAKHIWLNGV